MPYVIQHNIIISLYLLNNCDRLTDFELRFSAKTDYRLPERTTYIQFTHLSHLTTTYKLTNHTKSHKHKSEVCPAFNRKDDRFPPDCSLAGAFYSFVSFYWLYFSIMANHLPKLSFPLVAKWTGYVFGIPYAYVMYNVDEEQEKVLEGQRKYSALKTIRVMKGPFRAADPEGDERIGLAEIAEIARMREIGVVFH